MVLKGPVSGQSPSSFLMGQMCTQACSALSRNVVGNEGQLRWPGEPGHGGHRWRQTKERIVGPEDQGRRGSGYGEEGVQFCLNCAAHAELAARQGGLWCSQGNGAACSVTRSQRTDEWGRTQEERERRYFM